jgi:hypothetical protein
MTREPGLFAGWGLNSLSWDNDWSQNFWLASGKVEANMFEEAWRIFYRNLMRIVPRIAVLALGLKRRAKPTQSLGDLLAKDAQIEP